MTVAPNISDEPVDMLKIKNLAPEQRIAVWAKMLTQKHSAFVEGLRRTLVDTIELGRMLTEAKDDVGHGNWERLINQTPISARSASRFMYLYEHKDEIEGEGVDTVSGALKMLTEIKSANLAVSGNRGGGRRKRSTQSGDAQSKVAVRVIENVMSGIIQPSQELVNKISDAAIELDMVETNLDDALENLLDTDDLSTEIARLRTVFSAEQRECLADIFQKVAAGDETRQSSFQSNDLCNTDAS